MSLSDGSAGLFHDGLFHFEASRVGESERYQRSETSHTVHVWWARRPHSAMRMLVFATLCRTAEPGDLAALAALADHPTPDALNKAKSRIRKDYPQAPRVLDMFSGGGTIPFEAAALGLRAASLDSNEVAVFQQTANLNYSQIQEPEARADLVRSYGEKLLKRLEAETAYLFPQRAPGPKTDPSICYLWTYSTVCKSCGYQFYLSKRPWLSKKKGKDIHLAVLNAKKAQSFEIRRGQIEGFTSNWNGRTGKTTCPNCGAVSEKIKLADTKDTLACIVRKMKGGKSFTLCSPSEIYMPAAETMDLAERRLKERLKTGKIQPLPQWSGIVNPAVYGMQDCWDIYNQRQRLVLLHLSDCLKDLYRDVVAEHDEATGKMVVGFLSGLVDQLVDWNNRLSMWISQNEQVGRAFSGPGIPMLWDYCEIDPLGRGPANLWKKLERICDGSRSIPVFDFPPEIVRGSAEKLPYPDNHFDAVVTDPPYYDNIYYTLLADFFYAWKKIVFRDIDDRFFQFDSTDHASELVSSSHREKAKGNAHNEYCERLSNALREAYRVTKDGGLISFVYSHSSVHGWHAVLEAFRHSGFWVHSVQPLAIERKQRPRGMTAEAINTCVVIVGIKKASGKTAMDLEVCFRRMAHFKDKYQAGLNASGWRQEDIGLSLFAVGLGELANMVNPSSQPVDLENLGKIETWVTQAIPEFSLQKRGSL